MDIQKKRRNKTTHRHLISFQEWKNDADENIVRTMKTTPDKAQRLDPDGRGGTNKQTFRFNLSAVGLAVASLLLAVFWGVATNFQVHLSMNDAHLSSLSEWNVTLRHLLSSPSVDARNRVNVKEAQVAGHPSVGQSVPVVDVLSIGSKHRPEYMMAQAHTWAAPVHHVRLFLAGDEDLDVDRKCFSLKERDLRQILPFCHNKRRQKFNLSFLDQHHATHFASPKWLLSKAHPTGWLCAQTRPVLALHAALKYYQDQGVAYPDFLVIVDDDTSYNIDVLLERLVDYPSSASYGFAGCLIRSPPYQLINHTLPFGGFGLTITKHTLERLVLPLHCINEDEKSAGPPTTDYADMACRRIMKQPLLAENLIYQSPMSLMDLMVRLVTHQPFSSYKRWERGFCYHSDWLWGYFLNFYNLTNHVLSSSSSSMINAADQGRVAVNNPVERIHGFGVIYKARTPPCGMNGDECNISSIACHYQTPHRMRLQQKNLMGQLWKNVALDSWPSHVVLLNRSSVSIR